MSIQKDSWIIVKEKLRAKGFGESQILQVYDCISEVAIEKGVKYLRL